MDRRAAKLPNDVLVEILALLPAKSFVRFKCVSKRWLALTSGPSYHNQFPHTASGLFFFHGSENFYISLSSSLSSASSADTSTINTSPDFLRCHESRFVINCCNEILLVCASDNVNPGGESIYRCCYYVCNPATGKWAVVPNFSESVCIEALAFDPHVSLHYHVVGDGQDGRFNMIFSSKTGKWATMDLPYTINNLKFRYAGIFFRGVWHVMDHQAETIVGVNLEEGKFCRINKLPESNMPCRCKDREGPWFFADKRFINSRQFNHLSSPPICGLGFSQGYFHYALEGEDDIKVWILRDYDRGREWVLKHSIDIKEMLERHGFEYLPYVCRFFFYIDILAFHPDMNVVFLLVESRRILAYHKNNGRSEEINYSPSEEAMVQGFFVYSPCLSNGLLGSERA